MIEILMSSKSAWQKRVRNIFAKMREKMHRLEFMRGELARARQMRANKVFLGCFLFLAIVTFLARFTIAVLLDFGLKDGQFYPDWWKTIISGEQTAAGGPNLEDPYWRQLFDRRPNFFVNDDPVHLANHSFDDFLPLFPVFRR
ncbi:hypothetical protein [Mycoplasma sp. ATU-Cv-508]|uniref:hypothetical protein n=1 Tax=Mycoplasma sp. ATU-Cv-508 TaxID=2048001 RepID=UPI000FDE6F83